MSIYLISLVSRENKRKLARFLVTYSANHVWRVTFISLWGIHFFGYCIFFSFFLIHPVSKHKSAIKMLICGSCDSEASRKWKEVNVLKFASLTVLIYFPFLGKLIYLNPINLFSHLPLVCRSIYLRILSSYRRRIYLFLFICL